MKVLLVSVLPPMNAPEADYGYYFSLRLADLGADVYILTTKNSIIPNHPKIKVCPVVRDWSWRDLARIASTIKACRPDIVLLLFIGWVYNEHPMVTFVPALAKRIIPDVAVITQFSTAYGAFPSFVSRMISRAVGAWVGSKDLDRNFGSMLRDSDSIIVLSDFHLDELVKCNPKVGDKSLLLPPPPILRMAEGSANAIRRMGRVRLGLADDCFVVAFFGYVYPGKGLETLMRAFSRVCRDKTELRLVIIGGVADLAFQGFASYADEMKRLACELEIAERVVWTGAFPWDSDAGSVYLHAVDLCVLPFDRGLALNNSSFSAVAAHGLPVISTRGAIVQSQFLHNENVYLCPPADPEALASAITLLIDDQTLREQLSTGVLRLSKEWFSWDRTINGILSAIGRTDLVGGNAMMANPVCVSE